MSAQEILDLARAEGVMIATAESCTGGMVAVALTDMPGSSHVLERGFVTYSNNAKKEDLDVTPESLSTYGAVSEQVAREMAEGALAHSHADLSVSVTGIAGPGASEHKPEGRVCFGLARKGFRTVTETRDFGAQGRDNVRRLSRDHALALLKRALT
ncbi:CinA family protein [Roseovarius sp. A21]|uniref:CinA family protein n=1 Tax=Roseovarius bejariae TaxID=2576383 RepID=A0A844CK02_9RHOB|nr:CinA family protein [Roseovarius bejariae]MRU13825.1 CinA family protein [Roseovarius bejariae]